MDIIINAGSENKGGTFEQAQINAQRWLTNIHNEGFLEVEMAYQGYSGAGNFTFEFKHGVTQKVVLLETHGFTDEEVNQFRFKPRVYWNGSSTAEPQISDWLASGFTYRIEYFRG